VKNKRLILVSCCAAAAFIASPALAGNHKKSGGMSKPQRMATRTAHVTPNVGHATRQMTVPRYNANTTSRIAGTRQQIGTRYYGGNRYRATRYYGNNGYYVGSPYYNGGGWGYPYGNSSVWPYVAASVAPYVASSFWAPGYNNYPYSYYGGYPYSTSYYGGSPYNYSYYGNGYGYGGSTVAAVQRRLGEMGYYQGAVDGVIGPRTRAAIAAFESRHGLAVDGTISRALLNRLGLG
jgi:hypothetical protein